MSAILDIERRVMLAVIESLKAYAPVVTAVGTKVFRGRTRDHGSDYPCICVSVPSCPEDFRNSGWYRASVAISAQTYLQDDATESQLDAAFGAVRGWAQETGLAETITATAAAKATASLLTAVDAAMSGGPFDESGDNIRARSMVLEVVCRPSRGAAV